MALNNWKEIKTYGDLPEYGTYVLVWGTDKKQYNNPNMHVVCMDDLDSGVDFRTKGEFYWLTENGTKIENVTHWAELPESPNIIENRKLKIEKIKYNYGKV